MKNTTESEACVPYESPTGRLMVECWNCKECLELDLRKPLPEPKELGKGYQTAKAATETMDFVQGKDDFKRTKSYPYTLAYGKPVGLVMRYEKAGEKTFRQATLHRDGLWRLDGSGIDLWPLYRLPALGPVVVVAEGEKAADAIVAAGFCATTTCGGAGKSGKTDLTPLKDRKLIVWPDNDRAGIIHAGQLLAALPHADYLPFTHLTRKHDAADLTADEIKRILTPYF
jgi:5S rRNA maturation endonuclease (ribonuclease M5)